MGGETFIYELVIAAPMAKGSGKGKKGDKGKKSGKPKKDAPKRSRFSPVKTQVHESDMREVSAGRAFLTSFVMFALILAPVLGLGLYFAREAVIDTFPTPEEAFMAGMAAGLVVSFVISLIFTRKAVASS